ncbi:solute carrier family 22 member 7-like isoform X1 [Babylonia areolata]|uniref:solute carrier family 22 member 7-like isoform X1 n=1 Tax=Babylonia areolata TaxID=304850 RepID=UPI003FD23F98
MKGNEAATITPAEGHGKTRDVTSHQGRSPSDETCAVDLEPILQKLGRRGRYQLIQLMLHLFSSFANNVAVFAVVFIGYEPDHQCSHMDNITQVEAYLPDDVTNFTLQDIQYHQCSIDVTVNTSGTSSTHSLPCVAGVNFSMPSYTSFVTEWSLVCEKTGLTELTQTGFFAGQAVGALLFSVPADRYGRRKVYVTCAVATMASLVAMTFINMYEIMLFCRIVTGFFECGMENVAYMMVMELLPHHWRCLASILDGILWACGCCFVAMVAYFLQGVSWRYLSLALASVYFASLLLPCFLDESLRWLLATGEMQEAERILKKACRMNGKDFADIQPLLQKQAFNGNSLPVQNRWNTVISGHEDELTKPVLVSEKNTDEDLNENEETGDEIACKEGDAFVHQTDVHVTKTEDDITELPGRDGVEAISTRHTVLDLFRYRVVLVPFLICSFVWMTNNLFYYGVMLGSAKLSGNRFLNFGLLSLLQIPSTLLALFLMPRFRRRPLGFLFSLFTGLFLLVSVGLRTLGEEQGVTLTLATVAQYVGMFAVNGSFCVYFVYYMEVFPTTMRSIGIGTIASIIRLTDLALPFLLVWRKETPWAPGVMVGCLCCLAAVSIWLLPETRHRKLPDTIEEIQAWRKKRRNYFT